MPRHDAPGVVCTGVPGTSRPWQIVVLALLLAGCAASGATEPRTPMTEGEHIYRRRCAACHRLYAPPEYAPGCWLKLVDAMAARSHLRDEERPALIDYLSAAARPSTTGCPTLPTDANHY